jgi:hypothetical protein
MECVKCGQKIIETNYPFETIDGKVCSECAKHYIKCYDCNDYYHEDEITLMDNINICDNCIDNWETCEECGEVEHVEDMEFSGVENTWYCENCYTDMFLLCSDCGEEIRRNDVLEGLDLEPYCEECWSEHFTRCCRCNEEMNRDEARYNDFGEPFCSDCFRPSGVMEYHEFEDWNFYRTLKDERNPRFYGIEMEIEIRDDMESAVDKVEETFDDLAVMEEDSSIENEGFEIITHPMTYKYLKKHKIPEKFGEITGECKGFHTNECGCHIHFSRNTISDLTLAKFLLFFAKNKPMIRDIAERDETTYWGHELKENAFNKVKKGHKDKYEAVNLKHADTIEVRIFRANLKPERIYKNIQFIESLIQFCQESGLNDLYSLKYQKFLKQNKKQFKEVYEYVHNNH